MAKRYSAMVVAAGSQGWVHATGYQQTSDVDLVAIVDVDRSAAEALARELDVRDVFDDYHAALQRVRPDIVSVCTPPAFHLDAVKAAVNAGVQAIHCEKPIALSYADVLEMDRLTREAGVQLTFNLQRRFDPVQRFARDQIARDAIGEVISIEGYCPNLPDWGTHIIDLASFYLNDAPASWVMGQVDVSTNRYVYGAFAETSSATVIKWSNGVNVYVLTGREPQTPSLNLENNLGLIVQGSEGRIDSRGERCVIRRFGEADVVFPSPFEIDSRMWTRGVDPAVIAGTSAAIEDLVESLSSGSEPQLSARHGVAGAELIFATYESSRSRMRVELPLDRHDNALLAGLAAGFWNPVGELRSTY
jgi:predicted dehydrogenase